MTRKEAVALLAADFVRWGKKAVERVETGTRKLGSMFHMFTGTTDKKKFGG